jgi:hypothetical protein
MQQHRIERKLPVPLGWGRSFAFSLHHRSRAPLGGIRSLLSLLSSPRGLFMPPGTCLPPQRASRPTFSFDFTEWPGRNVESPPHIRIGRSATALTPVNLAPVASAARAGDPLGNSAVLQSVHSILQPREQADESRRHPRRLSRRNCSAVDRTRRYARLDFFSRWTRKFAHAVTRSVICSKARLAISNVHLPSARPTIPTQKTIRRGAIGES